MIFIFTADDCANCKKWKEDATKGGISYTELDAGHLRGEGDENGNYKVEVSILEDLLARLSMMDWDGSLPVVWNDVTDDLEIFNLFAISCCERFSS